jgi:hypothetical protein
MQLLSAVELHNELMELAYTEEQFQELIKLIWSLPDTFWVRVSKRLIATVIVGVLHPYPQHLYPQDHNT